MPNGRASSSQARKLQAASRSTRSRPRTISPEPMRSLSDLAAIFVPYYVLPRILDEAMPAAPEHDPDEQLPEVPWDY